MWYFCIKLVQYSKYLVSTVATDGLASEVTVLSTHPCVSSYLLVNTLGLQQNDHHLTDNIFAYILLNENCCNFNNISLMFAT